MKKLIFITALCLLCSCMVGCSKNEPTCGGNGPPTSLRFDNLDDLRACYDVLNQDDETVRVFLKEKRLVVGVKVISNKTELQQLLTEMEGYKFPCPMEDSPYRIKQLSYWTDDTLEIVYQNEKLPNLEARAVCFRYDAQWQPPQFAENEVVSTLQLNGKKIRLKKNGALYGYYADEQAQFLFEVDTDSNGGYDTFLSIDKFVLTDLRTLLFGEE